MRHAIAIAALVSLAPATALAAGDQGAAGKAPAAEVKGGRKIEIKVNEQGFVPREVKLRKGEPVTLVFTRVTERTCITAIDIPDENVKKLELPLNEPVALALTPKKAGVEAFHCTAMGMGNGKLVIED
jgi:plastocyanin domain-containing protein